MKLLAKIFDCTLVIFVCLILSARALGMTNMTPDEQNPGAVYYCVPMYAWDTGYNISITYDEFRNQFKAHVASINFFGQTPVFNELVHFQVSVRGSSGGGTSTRGISGDGSFENCSFSFSQIQKPKTHSVIFHDLGHHDFIMDLQFQDRKVDETNRVLKCQIAPWFVEQFKGCQLRH